MFNLFAQFNPNLISLKKTIILLIISSIFLMGYVWTRIKAVQLSYEYSKLSFKERNYIEMNHKLRLELASLKSPERLTNIATKKLNLIRTPVRNKVFIKMEGQK